MSKLKQFQKSLSKHKPDLLIGVAIVSTIGAPILAIKATPKALQAIEAKKEEQQADKLTPMDTVKTCWTYYIPTATACVTSIACLIASNTEYAKRTATLAAAYKLSETALTEYQEAVLKTIGEKEEKAVREQVSQTQVEQNPIRNNEVFSTGDGYGCVTILEPISKRYFKSSEAAVRNAASVLNVQMSHDMFGYVSLSDFYDEIGLDRTDISDSIGWNVTKGFIDIDLPLARDPDGRPCFAIYYNNRPTWDYDKFK